MKDVEKMQDDAKKYVANILGLKKGPLTFS